MGGERSREHETTVTPDPPTTGGTGATTGGGSAPTGATPAPTAATPPAPVTADNPQFKSWVKAITDGDRSAALAQATSFCSIAGTGTAAMGLLDSANKSDAFYTLIKTSRGYSAMDRAQMTQLYNRPIPYAHKVKLYQARFNITISGTGTSTFTEPELDTLYAEAARLPAGHVENNPRFTGLLRTPDSAAAEGSYGNPTVNMRNQGTQARYAETFRHEIGHVVEASVAGVADLKSNQAGWKKFDNLSDFVTKVGYGSIEAGLQPKVLTSIDKYVKAGGPWDSPGKFEDELKKQLPDAAELKKVTDLFGTTPLIDAMKGSEGRFYDPAVVAKWAVTGGNAYFVNFYYHNVFSITTATHTDLKSRGNAAACFSDSEWFAEMYQEWYRTTTPGSGSFPAFVKTFFETKIDPYVASAGAPSGGGGGHPRVPR